jgi:hypothetical protein
LRKLFGPTVPGQILAKRAKDGITLAHAPLFATLSEMSLSVMSDNCSVLKNAKAHRPLARWGAPSYSSTGTTRLSMM